MKVKRFTAANMQLALRLVSQELGADAVILSSKKVADGFEVVAALDYQPGHEQERAEIERQLRLQQELEEAKAASREPQRALKKRDERYEERMAFAGKSDLSSTESLSAVLSGLKNDDFSRAAPAGSGKPGPDNGRDTTEDSMLRRRADQEGEWYNNVIQQMSGELRELKDWMVSHQGS
ncbi:MAG: hypothetical protein KKH95_12700, partial [Gammaproteobacteria bacterium]|nr:hypothetical protein [Gammaproteobacteria bacterium]